jgi:hypothetical protein
MVLISSELARRYGDQGIISISLHPGASSLLLCLSGSFSCTFGCLGGVKSELLRNVHPVIAWIVEKIRLYPVSLGTITSLYAATSEEALEMNGEVVQRISLY